MIDRRYTLRFAAPVSVFTGLGVAGLVDRTVHRDGQGVPIIPGSTVKGRWRYHAQRLLASGLIDGLRVHDESANGCDPAHACALCRLFGAPTMRGAIQFGDATPKAHDAIASWHKGGDANSANENCCVVLAVNRPDADIRPGIAVSRRRRDALDGHLFFDETVAYTAFEGLLRMSKDIDAPLLGLLNRSGVLVDALGARKAVGRGQLIDGITLEMT